MGETDDSQHRPLMAIKKPLLFQYKKTEALNSVSIQFQAFCNISKPQEILSRIVTMYPATEEQCRLYTEHCAKIFKGDRT